MKLAETAANAAVDVVTAMLDGGTLAILDGAAKTLVELRFSNPAFSAAKNGIANAKTISEVRVKISGKAAEYRCYTSKGVQIISGPAAELSIDDNKLEAFGQFFLDSFTYSQGGLE